MSYQEAYSQALKRVGNGEWKGLPRWYCKECPWDTLNGEEVAVEHVLVEHMGYTPEAAVQVPQPAEDRFGNELPDIAEIAGEDLSIDLSALTVDDIVELAQGGEVDVEAVIEAERSGKNRVTLIRQLEDLAESEEG